MHERIEKLLQKVEYNISVQYIIASFGESFNLTNNILIKYFEKYFAMR